MKESETPLGKAYAKAKETSAPPPVPNPYDVDVSVSKDSKDAVTRKYQTLSVKNLGSNYRARLAYDKGADKLILLLTDANTDKVLGRAQFAVGATTDGAQVRKAILDAVKSAKGQPISDADLQNVTKTFKALADAYTPVSDKGSRIDA